MENCKTLKERYEDMINRWIESDSWKNEKFIDRENKIGTLFVKDGIINYEEYKKQNLKILYITKESYVCDNEKKEGKSDLVKDIEDGVKRIFWRRLSEWTIGIKNPTVKNYYDIEDNERDQAIKEVAVINLKKQDGATQSNNEELEEYLKNDKYINFLKEQMETINPNLIVCCGTYMFFKKIFNIQDEEKYTRIHNIVINNKIVDVIDYMHPSYPISSDLLYFGLTQTYRQIKK